MLKFLVGGKRKAFTLIELMTTTLIMAIVICAAIPFAMKKDVQKRAVAGNVGVYECYYGEDGNLYEHIRTKDGRDSEPTRLNGTTCRFNPNAEYAKGAKNFQIVAIGGGGAGGTYNTQKESSNVIFKALQKGVQSSHTLESDPIKTLVDHGKVAFGTLSNAGGTNAWYWNAQRQTRECFRDYIHPDCWCHGDNAFGNDWCRCSTPAHQNFVVRCRMTKNRSNMDYMSVFNIGPRICQNSPTSIMETNLAEEDIFQAIYKYYGIAGSYISDDHRGDVTYHISAPSGIASCACLNDPVKTTDGTCMSNDNKVSAAGSAGDTYEYSTHSGNLRGAYIGNEYRTKNDGSFDEDGFSTSVTGFCDSKLSLAGTSFTCGNAANNNACDEEVEKTAPQRGFPDFYYRGNDYHPVTLGSTKSTINSYRPWYHKITMHWNTHDDHKAQGTDSLNNYGGNAYLRLITHTGQTDYALVPRGHHGNIPANTTGLNPHKSIKREISGTFPGFVSSTHTAEAAGNQSGICASLSNSYSQTGTRIHTMGAYCEDSTSTECNCETTCSDDGDCSTSCDDGDAYCDDTVSALEYYTGGSINNPTHITQTASCTSSDCGPCSCTASCTESNNRPTYTDSDYTCEHLNCCNNYSPGSKTFTVRYRTGTWTESRSIMEHKVRPNLECGTGLAIYRQIKNVPFERAFVASAGQNGTVRQSSYPKLDEEIILEPGRGGIVDGTGDNVDANGKASVVKKTSGQIILSAQGGLKGASDKLNNTLVGPCFLFTHRDNLNSAAALEEYVKNPGCLARHDVMQKPTYNALLMANTRFLRTAVQGNGEDFENMPGLGGDGAYANVFPDRFLLSNAVRAQVELITKYIGPDQEHAWSDDDGDFVVVGLDNFTTDEFIGNGDFASRFRRRYNLLQQASANFLSNTRQNAKEGRIPNFIEAKNGNNGAIVIIW